MLKVEILAVGSELLYPDRVDGNGPWLTDQLQQLGLSVQARSLVEDNLPRLSAAFKQALSQSDLVIATGGLGPTEDDLTRQAAAQALDLPLNFQDELWQQILARFSRLGRVPSDNNRRQAEILEGATALPNPKGTAPGQWLSPRLALLPGPPREMQPMFLDYLRPALESLGLGQTLERRVMRVFGLGESLLDERLAPLYLKYSRVIVSTLFSPLDVEVHLTAPLGEPQLDELEAAAQEKLTGYHYGNGTAQMAELVMRELRERGLSLVSAEWGSRGYLAQRLSAYSNYLGGQVEGPRLGCGQLRQNHQADYAISLQLGDEAFIEICGPDCQGCRHFPIYGDSEAAASRAAQQALDTLRRHLLGLEVLS